MFDFAWSEIVLIGGVALILIGPKDLPVAIKAVSEMIKKARRMAGEFQTHVDEMVRDANLQDVKGTFDELRRMDIKGKILDAVDGDRSISKTLADNPFDINRPPPPVPVPDSAAPDSAVSDQPVHGDSFLASARPAEPAEPQPPPPFIPPGIAVAGVPGPPKPPPAFVPPAAVALVAANRRVPFA